MDSYALIQALMRTASSSQDFEHQGYIKNVAVNFYQEFNLIQGLQYLCVAS